MVICIVLIDSPCVPLSYSDMPERHLFGALIVEVFNKSHMLCFSSVVLGDLLLFLLHRYCSIGNMYRNKHAVCTCKLSHIFQMKQNDIFYISMQTRPHVEVGL